MVLEQKAAADSCLFYVIGFQRSGTTLLASLLDRHPEVVCVEEPELIKRILYRQEKLILDINQDSIRKMLDYYSIPEASYIATAKAYLDRRKDEDAFLRQAYRLCNRKNAKVEGAKEVCDLTAFGRDFLSKLISVHKGMAKFIFIERNICGVVASFVKLGFYSRRERPLASSKSPLTTRNLRRFTHDYISCLNYIHARLTHHTTHFVAFRELIERPEMVLRKIFNFLGVTSSMDVIHPIVHSPSMGMRLSYNGINRAALDSWQDTLSETESAWIQETYVKGHRAVYLSDR